jgi:flagellar export protein FliJ
MKAFHFRLQRVLELRETLLKTEESRLEQLWNRRAEMQRELEALDVTLQQARSLVRDRQLVASSDLVALELFNKRVDRERKEGLARLSAHDGIIERQRQVVVEARRNVRLLEQLREKRKTAWVAESNQELEALAGEFSTAQWLRAERT